MLQIPIGNKEYRLFYFKRPDGRGQLTDGETIVGDPTITVVEQLTKVPVSGLISNISAFDGIAVKYLVYGDGAIGLQAPVNVVFNFTISTSNGQILTDKLTVALT